MKNIWFCKIGECEKTAVPRGGDLPMRNAVEAAYLQLTGQVATFCFSGWGAELTEGERACVENRPPKAESFDDHQAELAKVIKEKDEEIKSLRDELSHARPRDLQPVTVFTANAIWCAGLSDQATFVLEMCYRAKEQQVSNLQHDLSTVIGEAVWAMEQLRFHMNFYIGPRLDTEQSKVFDRVRAFLDGEAVTQWRKEQEGEIALLSAQVTQLIDQCAQVQREREFYKQWWKEPHVSLDIKQAE